MSVQLAVRALGCIRDERTLFDNLSFTLKAGQLYWIEGPNGSGKTTLLKILGGQFSDFTGSLHWHGQLLRDHAQALRSELLYMGHETGLNGTLSALENLQWYQALGATQAVDAEQARWQALARAGLSGFEDLPVERLSAGQQRRVALARLQLEPRALWILDEPFTAIDVAGVKLLEGWIAEHRDSGGGVIVTTHHPLALQGGVGHIRLDGQGGHHVDAA